MKRVIFACFGIQINADKTIYTIKRPIIPIKGSAVLAGHWLWFGLRFRAGWLSTGKVLIWGRGGFWSITVNTHFTRTNICVFTVEYTLVVLTAVPFTLVQITQPGYHSHNALTL